MNREQWEFWICAAAIVGTLLFVCICFLATARAYPYELLPNGTVVDNPAINVSGGVPVDIVFFNGSIYLVPFVNRTQNNYTVINQTNYNQTNFTCVNCSYSTFNVTNQTYIVGSTSVYNKSDVDDKLATLNTKITAIDLTPYATKSFVNSSINAISLGKTTTTTTYVSLTLGILALLGVIILAWAMFAESG